MGKLLGLLKLGTKLGLAGGTVFVTHQVKFSRAPKTWRLMPSDTLQIKFKVTAMTMRLAIKVFGSTPYKFY